MRKRFSIRRCASVFFCACCAGSAAHVYGKYGDYILVDFSPLRLAVFASLAASWWAWTIFPSMGRTWHADIFLIAVAFPCVGAAAGWLISFGMPYGILPGAYLAVTLPFELPMTILPIYLFGAAVAFFLPRRARE